jgi:microcystin-dependent protein
MEYFLGEIRLFAGNRIPRGWAICNGALMSVQGREALFSLLGTTYGGNGVNDFALPDLRSRVPLHVGQGLGLTPRALGATGGTESVSLTVDNLTPHSHTLNAVATPDATLTDPRNALLGAPATGTTLYELAASADKLTAGPADMLQNTGAGLPHENRMPCMALNYIIAIDGGIYPSRP